MPSVFENPQLYATACFLHQTENLRIPGKLLPTFIAFKVISQLGMQADSKIAYELKSQFGDPLIMALINYFPFQPVLVQGQRQFVRLAPAKLIGFTYSAGTDQPESLIIAKPDHFRQLNLNASAEEILATTLQVLATRVKHSPGQASCPNSELLVAMELLKQSQKLLA